MVFSSFLYSHNSQLFIVTYFVQLEAVTDGFCCCSFINALHFNYFILIPLLR
jgi:hypothetical protein